MTKHHQCWSFLTGLLFLAATAWAGIPGTDLYVPSLARVHGAHGSQWYATVWIHNPGTQAVQVQISYLVRDQSNPSPMRQTLTVDPGETLKLADVFEDVFGLSDAKGALRFVSNRKVVVSARSYNLTVAGVADSQGQFLAGMPSELALGVGEKTSIPGITQPADGSFRCNYALVETAGGNATVQVTLYDRDGVQRASKSYSLGAWQPMQVNLADLGSGMTVDGGRLDLEVVSGTGKVLSFASMVGNGSVSQDPSTLEMEYELEQGSGSGLTQVAHDATLAGDGTSSSPLGVADGGITNAKLAGGAVTTSKLADDSVTAAKIADGQIAARHLNSNSVGSDTIIDGTVHTSDLAGGAVTTDKISGSGASNDQVLKFNGSSVTWAADEQGGLTLPYSANRSSAGTLFQIVNSGTGDALFGRAESSVGVYGDAASTSGSGFGVRGDAHSPGGNGVFGYNFSTSGDAIGVRGYSASSFGKGVWGEANSGPSSVGVYGKSSSGYGISGVSESNVGVRGDATATAGVNYGILGSSSSPLGAGVRGGAPVTGVQGSASNSSGVAYGVYGSVSSANGVGVYGVNFNNSEWGAKGVVGETNSGGGSAGVYGMGHLSGSAGAFGYNDGGGYALYGLSTTGIGLKVLGGGSNIAELWDASSNRRWYVTSAGEVYADGSFHSGGADFAEMYPAKGEMVPGTVVGIGQDGRLEPATSKRATAVMGVVSDNPTIVGGAAIEAEGDGGKVPVAILGIVDVQASAASGPIRPGDLLCAGSDPGTAEKAVWAYPGTIIGKALEALPSGTGTIRMLVTLR